MLGICSLDQVIEWVQMPTLPANKIKYNVPPFRKYPGLISDKVLILVLNLNFEASPEF